MTETLRKCPTCKALLEGEDDRFCGFCGSPVGGAEEPRRQPPASPPAQPAPADDAGRDPPIQPAPIDAAVQAPAQEADPTFWIRNRGFGLLMLRVALGLLLAFGWNPMAMGGLGGGDQAEIMGDLPFWAVAALDLDLPQLYFGVAMTHMAAGLLIILGLLFRPACFLAAASYATVLAFQALWALDYMFVVDLVQSGSMILVFLGLMFAGPGRFAVGRAERKALEKK